MIAGSIAGLLERDILTEKTPEEELAAVGAGAFRHARARSRRNARTLPARSERRRGILLGGGGCYSVRGFRAAPESASTSCCSAIATSRWRPISCARKRRGRGIDLRVSATFPDDVRFAAEHKHDAIFVGALRARHFITEAPAPGQHAHAAYIAQARQLLEQLRQRTSAPILIDNLPEPTVQPLGLAERGITGHRARFRLANVALAEIAGSMPDVHVVDIAAALGAAGSERMLDDGQVAFTHFGSPGWMLQRPESEKAAVHGIFPDTAPLAHWVGGDPYLRETRAGAHAYRCS